MNKDGLKKLCAGILGQCVTDMKDKKTDYSEDIERFIKSSWGETVLGVMDLDASRVDEALNISARAAESRRIRWNNI